jgi:predicted transcriptional regulator
MHLSEVQRLLLCDIFWGEDFLNREVKYGCASDLMSDVLAFSREGALLMTGLMNVQTIQTAFIAGTVAVVFVRGKKPDDKIVAVAKEKGIPVLGTPYSMYEACGILYKHGVVSTMECPANVASSKNA